MRSSVKRALTLVVSPEQPEVPVPAEVQVPPAVEEPSQQLAFDLPAADASLTEAVILAWGQRRMHAVPGDTLLARRLGLDGWPTRACCGARVDDRDAHGGTDNPEEISCQGCLRALRRVGVLR